ncbi:hypothetical protein IE89_01625 [Heyndrickxia coagulans]|nr:hypothetical protein IE89_01625 [Heyndrickxia coagulans]
MKKQDEPLKKKATRRIRTVIQNMITMASKLVTRAGNGNFKVTGDNKRLLTFAHLYNTLILEILGNKR